MQRQLLRQAARQGVTLAELGSAVTRGSLAEVLGTVNAEREAAARCWQSWAPAHPATTATPASLHQRGPCLGALHGMATWAAQHSGAAHQAVRREATAALRSLQQQQQRRAASAQPALAADAASSSGSSGGEGLTLSDSAVERLKELQAESAAPVTLRVTVEGGGCSGFQYEFSIEEGDAALNLAESDRLFERDGVRLVCDDISLEFLKGATVDFESDLMRSAFVVASNPNAASSCGCGSSFVAK